MLVCVRLQMCSNVKHTLELISQQFFKILINDNIRLGSVDICKKLLKPTDTLGGDSPGIGCFGLFPTPYKTH